MTSQGGNGRQPFSFRRLVVVSLGAFRGDAPPSQATVNRQHMALCEMLWTTEKVAVGICSSYLHILIWLDPEQPAFEVAMSREVAEDYKATILPLTTAHQRATDEQFLAYSTSDTEWLLDVAVGVYEGEVTSDNDLPPLPNREEGNAVSKAHASVVSALGDFAKRHNARLQSRL